MIYAENILVCMIIPLLVSVLFTTGGARRFIFSSSMGMIVCLVSAYISGFLELSLDLDPSEISIYISPMIEEIMKTLPVLFCIFALDTDGKSLLIIAAGIGCGFATFENCCHLLITGAGSFSYVLIRGLAVGIMHIVCMLVLTLSLILAKRHKAFSFASLTGSLTLSMTYHGLYNLLVSQPGLSSYIGYGLPIATLVFLYFEYRKYRDRY